MQALRVVGEAKRREAALREAILLECDRWDRPPSKWEAAAVEDILTLPSVTAERAPADQLAYGGMIARQCHANASWYAENDPTGETEHVVGWWLQGDLLMLHSIVKNAGRYICITPQEWDVPAAFTFIPDPKIDWIEEGEFRRYVRDGHPIDAGLRMDPEAHRASVVLMRERLRAGMKPRDAMRIADREARERLGLTPDGGATAA